MTVALAVAVGLLGLMVAGLLAAGESSIANLSRARVAALGDEDSGRTATLSAVLKSRPRSLASVVVARILCQMTFATAVGTVFWDDRRLSTQIPVGIGAFLLVGAVEVIPKVTVVGNSDRAAMFLAPTLGVVTRLPVVAQLAGLIAVVSGRFGSATSDEPPPLVSEEELLAFAEVAAEAEVIESEEQELIESIIEFGDTIVREVMVPRTDMVTFTGDFRVADALEVVVLNGFSRIPVIGDSIDEVIGIVYVKDLIRAERSGREADRVDTHLRPMRVVPEQKRVAELLREMQAEKFHMAVVIDEYGGTAGLVTLEDLIEELVGEIVDEFDVEEPMVEPLGGTAWRVNARIAVDEVNDLLGTELPDGDWDSVGGLLMGMFGHVPVQGEAVEIGQHRLTAVRVQARRISRVRVEQLNGRADARPDLP